MPTHAERQILPYQPEQLFELVLDVAKYPEFLPWCVAARVRSQTEKVVHADLTIGQYLQPTVKHAAIEAFITPDEFAEYAALARAKGFRLVSASPLTRSSYHADKDFAALRAAR